MKPWPALLLSAALAASAPLHAGEVAAPHWGDALFRVYQGQTFGALTTLMASQQFGRIAPHDDEAQATRGGLLVAYGMHAQAQALFAGLAERGSTPAMRDRAWLALAQIRWQRGLAADAEVALARIGIALPHEREEERALLAAQLRLAAGDAAGAAARLLALQASSPYARYNLGVALLRQGDDGAGSQWLEQLAKQPAHTPEERSLRDRARLALGFAALQGQDPRRARAQLEQVRLQGPFSNQALLGFGWAAAQLESPRDALVPWQELLTRDPSDAAVLEARLAVPYALAELQAFGQAEDGYRQALAGYALEHAALEASIAAVRTGTLVDALLARNPGEDLGWLWQVQDLPALPHPAQLLGLLSTHAFQEALKDQRDLRFLLANLTRWSEDLTVFGDMLATRRQAFAAQLPVVQQSSHASALQALQARRQAESEALAQAVAQDDGVALARADERLLIERTERVQASLTRLAAAMPSTVASAGSTADATVAMDRIGALERLRRVRGALTWQLAHAQPQRAWDATKALRAVDAAIARAQDQATALAQAQLIEPARFGAFALRLTALAGRVGTLIPQVALLQRQQQQALQAMLVDALQAQQARLAEYSTQARFALAQLQDRATLAPSAPGGRDAGTR